MGVSSPKRIGNVFARPSFDHCILIQSVLEVLWPMGRNGMTGLRISSMQAALERSIGGNLGEGNGYFPGTGPREYAVFSLICSFVPLFVFISLFFL